MSDLKKQLAGQLQGGGAAAAKKPAFQKAARTHPKRITLDLTEAADEALREAAYEHRTTKAQLLRGLLELAQADPKLMGRAAAKGQG